MFCDLNSIALEEVLFHDQLLFEFSPAESLINLELPPPLSSDDSDWQLNDLDLNCNSFVSSASDLNEEETNHDGGFDFEGLDCSLLDKYIQEALNSDIANDIGTSGEDSPRSACALETHDYLPVQSEWPMPMENVSKIKSFGEPKFCADLGAYRCPIATCERLYAKASHVRAHLRRHSGEKPYQCKWAGCSWRFARSDELSRHSRSHSGDKPYRCKECSKRFARSDHLAKHGKVHARRAARADAVARRAANPPHSYRRSTRILI